MSSTYIHPPSPFDKESYAQLEEQAAQLQRELADIRTRQNALITVNRTPDEMLSAILAHLVQPASVVVESDSESVYHCDIIAASHVCRRWRTISIDDPALWTEVPLNMPKLAAIFLKRSQPVPVRIAFNLPKDMRAAAHAIYSRTVVAHIPRLRALSLHNFHGPDEAAWWLCQLASAAPALEELSLRVDGDFRFDLPLFGGNAPSLRKLSLCRMIFPPSSPLYQDLRYLAISDLGLKTLDLSELLQILQCAPRLEDLVLESLLREDVDTVDTQLAPSQQRCEPITLARLSSLKIVAIPASNLYPILAHLDIPANARIKIDAARSRSRPRFLLPPGLPPCAGLLALESVIVVSAWGAIFELRGKRDPSEDAPWTVSLCAARPHGSVPAEIVDARAVVSYRVTAEEDDDGGRGLYYLQEQAGPWELAWAPTLAGLDALRTLSVHGCRYFQHCVELFGVLAGSSATCPALEELEIVRARCDEAFGEGLLAMLRSRRDAGNPLRSVRLKEAVGVVGGAVPALMQARALVEDFELSAADAFWDAAPPATSNTLFL